MSLSYSNSYVKAAARMMRRQRRLQDALCALSTAEEQCTRIVQVFPRDWELAMDLAKKAGLAVERYFEGRMAVTGEREKVESFVATLRERIMGANLLPTDQLALSHKLEEKMKLTPPGKQLLGLQLAHQELTSHHPVTPQRMRQYRALAGT